MTHTNIREVAGGRRKDETGPTNVLAITTAAPGGGTMEVVSEFDQGDLRSTFLWQRWQGLRAPTHQTREPKDIAEAGDAWDHWLVSYLPNPADRVPIPRPVIPARTH
jgi:hypothetical protein